jgi:O-antigen ligase
MEFLKRNLIVLHVAVLVVYLTWVHGGTRPEYLSGIPWLTLLLAQLVLLLPQIRKGESLFEAQRRVWRAILRDPIFYIGLALSVFLLIQTINDGGEPKMDPTGKFWLYGVPHISWLPSSVASIESRMMLYWFVPVWVATLAVRHGMLRGGQRRLFRFMIWNGAVLSLFGFIQNFSGTQSLYWITPLPGYFFATFGYPNVAGAFFVLMFMASAGLWFQETVSGKRDNKPHWLLIPLAINFAGAIGSLSRAAILLAGILLVLSAIYCLAAAWSRMGLGVQIKVVVVGALLIAVMSALYIAFPSSNLKKEINDINGETFYDQTIGLREYQYQSAWAMFKDRPWFGVGGWGYRHYAIRYVTPEQYMKMVKGKGMANVHNDVLQFLAEHGVVGFGLMLAAVVALWTSIIKGAIQSVKKNFISDENDRVRKPPFLLRIPPSLWFILMGTTATVVHSMIDLPFRAPPVLMAWVLILACAPAFMARQE